MALWDNVIGRGLHADRPAAGAPGALYFESDTGSGFRDNGTSWDLVTGAPVTAFFLVQQTSEPITLPARNTLVTHSVEHPGAITLPTIADSAGVMVICVAANATGTDVQTPDGSHLIHNGVDTGSATMDVGDTVTLFFCDGVAWYNKEI